MVWKSSYSQFTKTVEYIHKDSPQNALQVRNDIEKIIDSLPDYPEKHSPDKNKIDNPENQYRAFEKHRLRISYRFYGNTIRIIRIRHTRQNPQSY